MIPKLPRINISLAITDQAGKAVVSFSRFWDQAMTAIENSLNSLAETLSAIQALQVQQAQQLDLINQALELAGLALETADSGGTTKSGSSTGSFLLSSTSFGSGIATVNLTSVAAGNLTIPGTGPSQQVGTTSMTGGTYTEGEYRIIEVDNGVDNGTVFTGQFNVTDITTDEPNQIFTVSHTSADAVAAFVSARTTTGNVDYRVEVRRVSGATMTGMRFYLFARRAP